MLYIIKYTPLQRLGRVIIMMSSLGYHTMELSLRLTAYEAKQLLQIFEKNRELYFKDNNNRGLASHQYHSSSRYYYIQYRQKYKGLSWTLRYCSESPGYMTPAFPYMPTMEDRCCTIKARINPKILLGLEDYIAAADRTYLEVLIAAFNQEDNENIPYSERFQFLLHQPARLLHQL